MPGKFPLNLAACQQVAKACHSAERMRLRRSNNSITNWSGPYNIPAGEILWAHLKDVTFRPKGAAFCPKPDHDLQPAT